MFRRMLMMLVVGVSLTGLLTGCDSEVTNPETAGEDAERRTQEYHDQVDSQERGQQAQDRGD